MVGLVFKSAIIAAVMAFSANAAATSQCNTNADCAAGYICGPGDWAFSSSNGNVCVKVGTCNNQPDPQFPNDGPKCGDSIFCAVGGSCGEGYYLDGNIKVATEVCVNQATGVQCAAAST